MRQSSLMGFDVGSKRIGVAVGNTLTVSAQPVAVIQVQGGQIDWPGIMQLIKDWRPAALVVGLPLTLDADEQPMTRRAREFAQALAGYTDLPVYSQDERHSSQEAARRFKAARQQGTRRRRDARQLDAMAAVVILERYMTTL